MWGHQYTRRGRTRDARQRSTCDVRRERHRRMVTASSEGVEWQEKVQRCMVTASSRGLVAAKGCPQFGLHGDCVQPGD